MRDFDVVSENFVVTNFEGFYAGALAFGRFEVVDPFPGMSGSFDNAIQFRRIARTDDASILKGGRRIIINGRLEQGQFIRAIVDRGQEGRRMESSFSTASLFASTLFLPPAVLIKSPAVPPGRAVGHDPTKCGW